MEEEAELALLEQRLQQTNQLASRMTGMPLTFGHKRNNELYVDPMLLTGLLSQLDTRLSRLDKTIAPFGIQNLTREASSKDLLAGYLGGYNLIITSEQISTSLWLSLAGRA
jgi:exocyst complex protein 7